MLLMVIPLLDPKGENLAMKKLIVAAALCAAVLPRMAMATTWYKVGKDAGSNTSTSFLKSQSSSSGWAQSEGGTVDTTHVVAAGNEYVIPKGDIVVRTVGNGDNYTFLGDSLTIAGELALNSATPANRTLTFANIIADDGIIGDWQGGVTNRIAGTMTIPEGKCIHLKVGGTDRSRCQVISAQIIGGGTIRLMGENNATPASLVSLSGDASGFTGTIDVDTYPPKNFTLEVTGAFGGTVTTLPPAQNVKAIRFSYSGLDPEKGLVIATTEIPDALQEKLTLTDVDDPTATDLPLMTFPAGASVAKDDFTIRHDAGFFDGLYLRENQDGTKTLVANHAYVFDPVVEAPAGAEHYVTIGLDGYSGEPVSGGLVVPLRIPASVAALSAANGLDFAIVENATGTRLDYEIDEWNPSGTSILWVRLSRLGASGNALTLYILSSENADNVPSRVWRDYIGVWHMNGTGATEANRAATGSAYDGTATNAGDGNVGQEGPVGFARFKPKMQVSPYDANLSNTKTFTVTFWTKCSEWTTGKKKPIQKGNWKQKGWYVETAGNNDNTDLMGWASNGDAGGNYVNDYRISGYDFREWNRYALVADGDRLLLYVDKYDTRTTPEVNLDNIAAPTTPLLIDNEELCFFDEVRVSPNVLSVARIRAEYDVENGTVKQTYGSPVVLDDIVLEDVEVQSGTLTAKLAARAAGTVWRLTGNEDFGEKIEGWTRTSLGEKAAGTAFTDTMTLGGFAVLRYALVKGDESVVYTPAQVLNVPILGTVGETFVGVDSATLSVSVENLGASDATEIVVVTGATSSVETLAEAVRQPAVLGANEVELTGLAMDTTYCYQVRLTDGSSSSDSPVRDFTTKGLPVLSGYSTSADQRTVKMRVEVAKTGPGTLEVWMHYTDNHGTVNDVLIGTLAEGATVPATLSKDLTLPNFGDTIKGGWYVFTTNRLGGATITWQSSWPGQSSDMAPVADKATYTWQAVNNEWSGDWTNAAHWTCNKTDNMGYPQRTDAGSKVTFENVPDGVTATVGVSAGCAPGATFRWHGQSGSTVVLKGLEDGVSFVRTPEVIDRDNVSLVLDHMELRREANWPELKNNEVGKERRGISLALRNGAELTGNYSIILAAPQSSIVVEGGSQVVLGANKLGLGGDGTRMTIDDSTVSCNQFSVPDWQDAQDENIVIEFKGAAPKLIASDSFDQNDKCADPHLRFFVPVGGYSEAPIQMPATATKKFGEKAKPDSTSTAKEIFEIAPESPFLTEGKVRHVQTMSLVTTVKGIETNWMMDFADVVKPKGSGVCTLSYGYEESDIEQSNPTSILLDLKKAFIGFAIFLR